MRSKDPAAQRRDRMAKRARQVRRERDLKGQCRTCGEPAAVNRYTGKRASQCARHLACDSGRKVPYILPEVVTHRGHRGSVDEEWVPLALSPEEWWT
jgi:hypothetical protein